MKNYPKVGIAVVIKHDGKILLGKRRGAHGEGTWAPPGGKLDFGENVHECAKREIFEETGLKIKDPKFLTFTNDIFKKEKKHYITLWFLTNKFSGKTKIMEPEKLPEIEWFSLNKFPTNLFLPFENLLKKISF